MKRISIIWFAVAIVLLVWSLIGLWEIAHNPHSGINNSTFKATLLGVGFSSLCIIGSVGLMLKKNWGRIIIILSASLSLLYAVAYLLMGGYDDTGPIYASAVAGILLLSFASFVILAKRRI